MKTGFFGEKELFDVKRNFDVKENFDVKRVFNEKIVFPEKNVEFRGRVSPCSALLRKSIFLLLYRDIFDQNTFSALKFQFFDSEKRIKKFGASKHQKKQNRNQTEHTLAKKSISTDTAKIHFFQQSVICLCSPINLAHLKLHI